jgi:hypothetical protein
MPNEKHTNKKHLAHLEVVRRQDRIIRISAIVVILLVIGIVGFGILNGTVLLQYRAVATVNGDTITVKDFQQQVKLQRIQSINQYMQYLQFAQMLGIQDPSQDPNFSSILQQQQQLLTSTDVMGKQVLDMLINDRLTRQEAKKRGLTVSKDEVEKALQDSTNYYPNGTPTSAPTSTAIVEPTLNPTQLALVTLTPTAGPTMTATPDANATPTAEATTGPTATAAATATPAPTATPVTAQGYQELLKQRIADMAKNTGMDEAAYRTLIESSLLRDKLLADVTKDLKPVEEQVWARHILVGTIEEAVAVQARLRNGDDFAKVAAEMSTDTGTKDKGGDLGWFAKGAMVAPFSDAAFSLAVGQISEPVKSDYGFHIIQVLGHEVRPVDDKQFQQQKQTTFSDFLKTLRDASDVQIFDLWKTNVPTEPALPNGL